VDGRLGGNSNIVECTESFAVAAEGVVRTSCKLHGCAMRLRCFASHAGRRRLFSAAHDKVHGRNRAASGRTRKRSRRLEAQAHGIGSVAIPYPARVGAVVTGKKKVIQRGKAKDSVLSSR
jgi:hypothetical protein